jgi:Xaa-Pro aminopeptidase
MRPARARRCVVGTLPRAEFTSRVERLREVLEREGDDVFLVYGDEYRRESLRYVSNYWPIFDRGTLVVGRQREPILLVAPEGANLAKEMAAWQDIRIVHELEPSYIPDKVDYASASYAHLDDVLTEAAGGRPPKRVRICGIDAMPFVTFEAMKRAVPAAAITNGDPDVYRLRLVKSPAETALLRRSWEICDAGYKALLDADIVGMTEIQAAAIAEKAARDAGAEGVVFTIFCSGERTNTAVGRATRKVIRSGEMVMACLATQYEGYIASDEWPFVAGGSPTREQAAVIDTIVKAEQVGIDLVRAGVVAGEVVRAVKAFFASRGMGSYDIYPPIHGNGLAEAESPYPDARTTYTFDAGMGINFDVNLFGVPGVGSNRIEEGFVVSPGGVIVLSDLISGLRRGHLRS